MAVESQAVPASVFNDTDLTIFQTALDELAKINFVIPRADDTGRRNGSLFGLTNDRVAGMRERLFSAQKPGTTFTQDELWVLYCGTLILRTDKLSVMDKDDPVRRIAEPFVDRVHGRLLLLRGFDNSVAQELLAS